MFEGGHATAANFAPLAGETPALWLMDLRPCLVSGLLPVHQGWKLSQHQCCARQCCFQWCYSAVRQRSFQTFHCIFILHVIQRDSMQWQYCADSHQCLLSIFEKATYIHLSAPFPFYPYYYHNQTYYNFPFISFLNRRICVAATFTRVSFLQLPCRLLLWPSCSQARRSGCINIRRHCLSINSSFLLASFPC